MKSMSRLLGLGVLALALVGVSLFPTEAKSRPAKLPWIGYPYVIVYIQVVDKDDNPVEGIEVKFTDGTGALPVIGEVDKKTDKTGWTADTRAYDRSMTYSATSDDGKWKGKVGPNNVLTWVDLTTIRTDDFCCAYIQIKLDVATGCDDSPAAVEDEFSLEAIDEENFIDSMAMCGRGR